VLAHITFASPALVFTAEGLFLAGIGAAIGCYVVARRPPSRAPHVAKYALGAFSIVCLVTASAIPFLVGPDAIRRPSSSAHLTFLSPRPNEVFRGAPATVTIDLRLDGGTIMTGSSTRVVPNEGHVHLYLDGKLVQMTATLSTDVVALPGGHTLRAEFVASDHGPFHPPVTADVGFLVQP
jgi:hypothetical protein